MQIAHIRTVNIGGLIDCDLALPADQVTAIAGANGTGKSKLLACMLLPWTHTMPAPSNPEVGSEVHVTLSFSDDEVAALQEFHAQLGHPTFNVYTPPESPPAGIVPQTATFSCVVGPMVGAQFSVQPPMDALKEFVNPGLLTKKPSLDAVYLPAERRFVPQPATSVDLTQLGPDQARAKLREAREAAYAAGTLDDSDFEQYAKSLCFKGSLPNEPGLSASTSHAARWEAFKESVDNLLSPKKLLGLTAQYSDQLRIELPDKSTHPVQQLSSGERQALFIISRVFRAGTGQSFVAIDEPDAHLHPSLCARLMQALRPGLGTQGHMIVATHSPAILDSIDPRSIVRLAHDAPAAAMTTETDRLELYRDAGFRASTLTQADLLVVTEGAFDAHVLPRLSAIVASAGLQAAGGRSEVLKTVQALAGFDVPIVGVVDADVRASAPPAKIVDIIHVWPAADIEGVLLQDPQFIDAALTGGFFTAAYTTADHVRYKLRELLIANKDAAISEYAQAVLRERSVISWPSPRGVDPLGRLRGVASSQLGGAISSADVDAAIDAATKEWDAQLPEPWKMVRGKYLIGEFVSATTNFKDSASFVTATLNRRPKIAAVEPLEKRIASAMAKP